MESLLASVKGMEDISPATASMLVQGVACLPGWAEKNFQVCWPAPLASPTISFVQLLNPCAALPICTVIIHLQGIGFLVDSSSNLPLSHFFAHQPLWSYA